jgi:hypothetical protein
MQNKNVIIMMIIKFTPEQAMKGERGSRGIDMLFL